MNLNRRRILQLAAAAAVAPVAPHIVRAQGYPARTVRLFVGYPPGGNADLAARLIGQRLSERLGQPFVIENRAGANTNLAAEAVVRAPADGHTLLLVVPPQVINVSLYEKLNYDIMKDIVPVASILDTPLVVEVNPSIPARTIPEFIAYAKAHPGKLNVGSPGTGSVLHLATELFKMMSSTTMMHVPYRGTGPALTALLGGQIDAYFDGIPTSIEHIKAGRLRPLAVTSTQRLPALPDIPTVSEFLPGFEAGLWFGIGAPKGTSQDIVDTLNREVNATLADATLKARLAAMGANVMPGSSADFGKFLAVESDKWNKVVKFASVKMN